jgi:ATP-binding cassette subfamily A (ABC1) protein 3
MFREIESCMRRSISKSEMSSSEDKSYPGIESYGISVTTLEEVFLRVAGCGYDETDDVVDRNNILSSNSTVPAAYDNRPSETIFDAKILGNYKKIIGFISAMVGRVSGLMAATILSFINFLGMQCCSCCIISRSTFWQHTKALFIKRAISARRDRKTIVFQLLIPAIFLLFGLLFLKLKSHPDQQSVTLTTSHFNPLLSGGGGGGPIPFDLSLPIAKEVCRSYFFLLLSVVMYAVFTAFEVIKYDWLLNFLLRTFEIFKAAKCRLLDILKGGGFKTLDRVHTDSLMQRGNWLMQSRQQDQLWDQFYFL